MKVRIPIFFYVFTILLSCKTSKPLELFNDKQIEIEPGKCYVSTLTKKSQALDNYEEGFLLEIEDPFFKEYKTKITQEEIAFYDPKIEKYQIRTRNAYSQFKFRNDIFSENASSEDQIGFLICNVESPSVYKVITKEELVNVNTIVTRYKLVSESQIFKTKLSRRPSSLTRNQYFMASGEWSSIKEYVGPSSCGPSLIPIVKKKLNELGYNLIINDKMDANAKIALIEFQRINGLKEGKIDRATLEKLKIY